MVNWVPNSSGYYHCVLEYVLLLGSSFNGLLVAESLICCKEFSLT